jgi:hypothetical protein
MFTLNSHLPHVRHVEQHCLASGQQVLGNDALILHRHVVAGKGHHLRAELHVQVEQGRPLQRCCGSIAHQAPSVGFARSRK